MTDIRRDEFAPVALMFVYGFLALTSYYLIKPARNSVFVDRVGADNLPYVYILTAIVATLVMLLYSRYVDRIGRLTLLLGTFAFLAANLFLFWWLLRSDSFVVSGAFYIWGKLYPLFLVSQFWLVANLLFTTRQGRRLFWVVGVGPILGGIAGSAITAGIATLVGTRTLLLIAIAFLILCAGVVLALAPRLNRGVNASGRLMKEISGDAVRLFTRSPHLRTIAAILGLTIVVGTLIDWQFSSAVERWVPGEDEKTAFFGQFFVALNVGSVLVQIFLTGFVLRKLGVGPAMLALPVGLLIASVGVFVAPMLLTAAFLKGTEGGLRYSLDQSTRELLYLPVPTDVKYKVKPLIDLAVYRGGTGLGGLILIVAVNLLGFSIRQVAILSVLLIGAWALTTLRMRREFRESIKRLIGVRDVDLEDLIVQRLDAGTLAELREALRRGNEGEVLYALDLLEHRAPAEFETDLRCLLAHESAAVRVRALTHLHDLGAADVLPDVQRLLKDPSLLVRVEAIHFVCRYGSQAAEEQMAEFLQDPDGAVRLAAIACPLQHEDSTQRERAVQALMDAAASGQPSERQEVASELAQLESLPWDLRDLLGRLILDTDAAVRHEAVQAAGATQSRDHLPELVSRLCCGSDRKVARSALERFGPSVHEEIIDFLRDRKTPERVRLELPGVLFESAEQRTADLLVEALPDCPPPVRFRMLKMLTELRRDRDDLDFERYAIRPLVRREVTEGYRWAAIGHALANGGVRSGALLISAVAQRSDEAAERALRTLGLRYPLEDLYAAYTGLQSPDALSRERGYELLDNTLPRAYRELFDPLLNPDAASAARAAAARRFGLKVSGPEEILRGLADGEDRWVALLARLESGIGMPPATAPPTPPFHEHSVAETLLGTNGGGTAVQNEETRMAKTIEKAELVRGTDLFSGLRTKDQAVVATLADEREYPVGYVIYREGEPSTELYILVEGRIVGRQGDRVLFTAQAGETVGDLALLDGLPRDYEAVVLEPTRVLALEREAFFNLMEERFQMVRDVLTHITGVVRKLNKEYRLPGPIRSPTVPDIPRLISE